MAFQPSVDSFGIRRLGFKCSWWHRSQANDAVASEQSILSENHDLIFFRVAVNTYVPIFLDLDARGGRKLRTDTQKHTRDNYSNPRCAHARRGLIIDNRYTYTHLIRESTDITREFSI